MKESRTKKVRRNIFSGSINKMIGLGIPFFTRSIILWKLGASFIGLSSLFASVLQVLNMAELGFSSAIVYSLYKPMANKDVRSICALMSFYRRIYKCVGVVILFVGGVLTPFIPCLIKGSCPETINIYFLYLMYLFNVVISYWGFAYKSSLIIADQRMDIINNINTVIIVFQGVLQIIVLVLWEDYYLFYICVILGTIANNVLVEMITLKKYPDYICKGDLDKGSKNEIKKQVRGLAISKISVTARNALDSIFLSAFCGLIEVAIYSNYYYIFSAVLGMMQMLRTAFSASVGNSIATRGVDENYALFKKMNLCFILITNFCVSCLVCLYQPFMDIWTDGRLVADFSVAILFGIYFFVTSYGQVRSLFQEGAGIWWQVRNYAIAETFFNVILNAILGYRFGMYGILIATMITVSVFSMIAMAIMVFKEYFHMSPKQYFIELSFAIVQCITVSMMVYYCCDLVNIGNRWFSLIVKAIICMIETIVLLFLSSCFCDRYRKFFYSLMKYDR